ncbi:MAG: hypothetical protein RH945_01080 [Hyphomonas sp.]
MSSSVCSALFAGAATLCLAANAQIEDSGLQMVDPWGMGFLEAGEPALPASMWRASSTKTLLPMMRDVPTQALTPAERTLMRRMALSPANAPQGTESAELLAERARILFELGEARPAASLMARLDTPPPGLDSDEIATDLNLALGNEAMACAENTAAPRDGAYWAMLRAVCAALRDNTTGAELAIEIAASQGVDDSWLTSAVFAASGELPNPPQARYDSGIALAISAKAALTPPSTPLSPTRPDLAAAMVARPGLPPATRAEAAAIAAEAGLIDVTVWRQVLDSQFNDPEFTPESPIEIAIATARNVGMPEDGRADAIAAALQAAAVNPARFVAVSKVLTKEITSLSLTRDTAKHALLFARASLAAKDFEGATLWTLVPTLDEAPETRAFDFAMISGLAVLAGSGDAIETGERLVTEADTKSDRKAAARLFALWTMTGITPPPAARALMATDSEAPGKTVKPGTVLAILAAADQGAAGEVILGTVALTNGDPSKLDTADLALLGKALATIGAEGAASELALEATGYWQAAK